MNMIYKERRSSESPVEQSETNTPIINNSSDSNESSGENNDIIIEMNSDNSNESSDNAEDKRQKRKQLSKSATKTLNRINTEVILYFD
jgi:hypothetical protein